MKWILWVAAIFGLGIVIYARNSRAATATPAYQLLKKEGRFEIRKYPGLTLATAPMRSGKGMNGAFGSLFRFITGQNASQQKISMTTPVFLSPAKPQGDQGTMSFILPPGMEAKDVPAPASAEVTIRSEEGGEFAAYRYSGSWSAQAASAAREKLKAWVEQNGLKADSEEIVAYYDPPWTPTFLRRNEVLTRLAPR